MWFGGEAPDTLLPPPVGGTSLQEGGKEEFVLKSFMSPSRRGMSPKRQEEGSWGGEAPDTLLPPPVGGTSLQEGGKEEGMKAQGRSRAPPLH